MTQAGTSTGSSSSSTGSSSSSSLRPLLPHSDKAGTRHFIEAFLALTPALQVWATLRVRAELRRHVDPEDIVQETGVRALTSYRRFDSSTGNFRSWLFGIATKVLLKQYHALERGILPRSWGPHDRDRGPDADSLIAEITSITSQVARREQLDALARESKTLNSEERWLLIYRGLEQLGYADIGSRMGLSQEAVRTRWRRLLAALRKRPALKRYLQVEHE